MKQNYFLKFLIFLLATCSVWQIEAQTTFNYTGAIQTYTVPAGVTSLRISADGAQGGTNGAIGGFGANMSGDFVVAPGDQLLIAVGESGRPGFAGTGGGGGSYIVKIDPTSSDVMNFAPYDGVGVTPLIIAGGGGAGDACSSLNGQPGVTTLLGTTSTGATNTSIPGNGGVLGSGGSGGGGFRTDGTGFNSTDIGSSFLNGGAGVFETCVNQYAGGYSGGAGTECACSGGGGGGYTGGDGGDPGGGGGSYNSGINQVNTAGANAGNGQVVITVLCDPLNVTVTPGKDVCPGTMVTITGTSSNGGTITWDNGITNGVAFAANTTTTYTSSSTNSKDCIETVTIIVEDNEAPTAIAQDITVELDSDGQATIRGDYSIGSFAGKLEPQNSFSISATQDCDCPEGFVAVGYEGYAGWIVDDFRLICKEVLADGTLGTETVETCFSGSRSNLGISNILTDNEILVGFQIQDGDFQHQQSTRTHVSVKGIGKPLMEVANANLNNIENTILSGINGSGTSTTNLNTTTKYAPTGHAIVGMSVNQTTGYSSSVSFKYASISSVLDINNGSSDNCQIASISADIYEFDCENIGDNAVVLSVTDVNGNVTTANATVTVEDKEAPTAIAQNITVELDANGLVSISPEMVNNESIDNCTPSLELILSLDKTTFNCSNIGANEVVLTVIDANDNKSTTSATVTVEDNIAPEFVTSDVTLQLDSNGVANLTPEQVIKNYNIVSISGNNGVNGNTDFTVQLSSDADISFDWNYSTDDGPNWDTFGYLLNNVYNQLTSNSFGNSQNGTFSLNVFENDIFGFRSYTADGIAGASTTVVSNFSPGFVSQFATDNWQLNFSNAGGDAYFAEDSAGSAFNDACGISSVEINPNIFSCLDIGENTVTITVTDVNGNMTEKTAVVTVEDNLSPEIVQPEDLVLNTNNGECSHTFLEPLTVEASDNCEIESIVGIRSDGLSLSEPFPLGETTISWTATDASANVFPSSEKFEERVLNSQDDFSGEETHIDFEGLMDSDAITDEFLEQGVRFLLDDGSEFGTGVGVAQVGSGDNKALINESPTDEFPKVYNLEMTFPQGVHRVGFEIITPFMGSELPIKFVRNGEIIHNETYLLNENSYFIGYESPELFDQVIIEIPTSFDGGDGPIFGDGPFPGDGPIPGDAPFMGDAPVEFSMVFMDNLRFEGAKDVELIVQKITVVDEQPADVVTKDITVQLDENGIATIIAEDVDNGSSDGCGIASMSVSPNSFTCTDVGENTVTLTVIDNNGNESTATSRVTVEDNVAPVAITQDITVQLDENGTAAITAEDVNNDSSDACGIASMSVSPNSFTCAEVGENTVTLIVIDNNGNESTATSTVTVEDNVTPIASAQHITIQLDETGNASITAEDVDNDSSDACGIASMSVSPDSFTCAEVGENTVTLTVIDNNGNESTATSRVTVEDNVAPVASTQDITVQLDDNGTATITAEEVDNDSSDACGIASMSVSPNSFTCAEVGENTVTLTVIDNNGNESTATSRVTVEDNVAPVASAQDITVQLDDNGTATITVEDVDNGSSDACGIASMSVSPDSFTCAEVGENMVTLTVIDNNGNESTATSKITVEDNLAPVVITQDITVQLDENGTATITAEDVDNGSSDACGIASMSVSPDSFTCAEIGENAVTLTVIDTNGNESTTASVVTVEDSIKPIPSADTLPEITAECEVVETDVMVPTATDNCGGVVSVSHDVSFPITDQGLTVITWSFEDVNGNIATQTQDVMLEDMTVPVPDVDSLEDFIVECEATTIVAPTATDNCTGTVTGTTLDPTSYSEEGEFMILWEFNDGNGNISSQEQWVTVKDNTAPEVTTQDLTVTVTQDEPAVITPEEVNDGSTDNCSELVFTLDRDNFDKPGVYEVVLTATDASGNTSQATAKITVKREGANPSDVHVVPTMLTESSIAKVIMPFNGRISEVHVMEAETNTYKVFEGNKKNTMQIDIAPMKGTLLVKIIDTEGNVYMKKLIAL